MKREETAVDSVIAFEPMSLESYKRGESRYKITERIGKHLEGRKTRHKQDEMKMCKIDVLNEVDRGQIMHRTMQIAHCESIK